MLHDRKAGDRMRACGIGVVSPVSAEVGDPQVLGRIGAGVEELVRQSMPGLFR